ncbi:MAG TPA: hypothetical protein PLI34_02040, partial [Saprospiraceae bacterium]|nr:hypothetical protein [Saprospiraceae bacterium]
MDALLRGITVVRGLLELLQLLLVDQRPLVLELAVLQQLLLDDLDLLGLLVERGVLADLRHRLVEARLRLLQRQSGVLLGLVLGLGPLVLELALRFLDAVELAQDRPALAHLDQAVVTGQRVDAVQDER